MNEDLRVKLGADLAGLEAGLRAATASINNFKTKSQSSFGSLDRVVANLATKTAMWASTLGTLALSVTVPMVMGKALHSFVQYESAVTDMGKVTSETFDSIKKKIGGVSEELGTRTELMQGYYQIISAGVTDTAKAQDLLITASKASKAAHLEQSETIKALTKLMNGYKGVLTDSSDAADLLFMIEKRGQTTFRELVPVIGEAAAISAQLNVRVEEMGGFLAQSTQILGSTSQAVTAYQALLTGLLKPQEKMREMMRSIGYVSGEAMVKELGLVGSLKEVEKYSKSSGIQLGRLFESKEALLVLGPALRENFATISEAMKDMEARAGATDRAFSNWKKTFAAIADTFRNTIGNFMIDLGEKLAPKAIEAMEGITNWLKDNRQAISDHLDAIGKSANFLFLEPATFWSKMFFGSGSIEGAAEGKVSDLQRELERLQWWQKGALPGMKTPEGTRAEIDEKIERIKAAIKLAEKSNQLSAATQYRGPIGNVPGTPVDYEKGLMEQRLLNYRKTMERIQDSFSPFAGMSDEEKKEFERWTKITGEGPDTWKKFSDSERDQLAKAFKETKESMSGISKQEENMVQLTGTLDAALSQRNQNMTMTFEREKELRADVYDHAVNLANLQAEAEGKAAEQSVDIANKVHELKLKKWNDTYGALVALSERTANAMEQAFSDFFFNTMTGKMSTWKDWMTGLMTSMGRAVSDYMGQLMKVMLVGSDTGKGKVGGLLGKAIGALVPSAPTATAPPPILPMYSSQFGGLHRGGKAGYDAPTFMRNLATSFVPRLHSGLNPNEFPAILEKGETVTPKGGPSIQINVINQTGTQMNARQQDQPKWDGKQWVLNMVLEGLGSPSFANAIRNA